MIVFLSVRFYRNNIQKEFLAEKDLTFAKAFETAQPMEMPNREDFNEVRIPPEVSINKINRFSSPRCPGQGSGICFCCAQNITHRNAGVKKKAHCYRCQKKGLIANKCTQNRESHSKRHVENVSLTDAIEGTVDLSLYILKGKGKGRCGY